MNILNLTQVVLIVMKFTDKPEWPWWVVLWPTLLQILLIILIWLFGDFFVYRKRGR